MSAVRAETTGSPMPGTSLMSQPGPAAQPVNSEPTPTTPAALGTVRATDLASCSNCCAPTDFLVEASKPSPSPTRYSGPPFRDCSTRVTSRKRDPHSASAVAVAYSLVTDPGVSRQ